MQLALRVLLDLLVHRVLPVRLDQQALSALQDPRVLQAQQALPARSPDPRDRQVLQDRESLDLLVRHPQSQDRLDLRDLSDLTASKEIREQPDLQGQQALRVRLRDLRVQPEPRVPRALLQR